MEFFDYDPFTGITTYYAEQDGKIHLHQEQDVQPFLDFAAELRNTGWADRNRHDGELKHEGRLWAIIPPIIQAELFKKGINIMDQNDNRKLVAEIEANYPRLKVSNKRHAVA